MTGRGVGDERAWSKRSGECREEEVADTSRPGETVGQEKNLAGVIDHSRDGPFGERCGPSLALRTGPRNPGIDRDAPEDWQRKGALTPVVMALLTTGRAEGMLLIPAPCAGCRSTLVGIGPH